MDNLIEILRGTLDSTQSKQAEEFLNQIKKNNGFSSNLFTIVASNDVDEHVRQAAAIALKNNISEYWMSLEDSEDYSICIEDKTFIKNSVIDVIINIPNKIRVLLLESLQTIIRNEFPTFWNDLPNKIMGCLLSDNQNIIMAGYECLSKLIKSYEYKKNADRQPINAHMANFLDIMRKHTDLIINDQSESSVTILKHILKIYYIYTHCHLSVDVINKPIFEYWLNILCLITQREVPDEVNQSVDADERQDLIWWKCKKWAVHILSKFTDKYSNPSTVIKASKEFSLWFLHAFTEKIIQTLFSVCEKFSLGFYISPRILTFVISSFEFLIKHSHSWKYLKPHLLTLVQEVLFKMLSHSEEDQELWVEDPLEYCKLYFDILSDPSPKITAGNLLNEVCSKRKGALETIMNFVTGILNSNETSVIQKDTAFSIIGHVASVLVKRKAFSSQMEAFLINYAVPVFQAPEGFRRFRAFWLVGELSDAEFNTKSVLDTIVQHTLNAIANDPELPVKVMASNTLSGLMVSRGEEIKDQILPHLNGLVQQVLSLLREAQVDDLNDVLQNLISLFSDNMASIAIDTVLHLKETLCSMLEEGELDDNKEIIIMGLLSTVETVCKSMEDQERIIGCMEPIVVSIMETIFRKEAIDFYEEAYSLAASLTTTKISPTMWQVLNHLRTVIESDPDEIADMMPLLSNFVSVDKPSLTADATRIETLLTICQRVLSDEDVNEMYESYAAKLLEMIFINYRGLVDNYVVKMVEIVVGRLVREPDYSELRTMCLQTVMAALYYNEERTLSMLLGHNWPGTDSLLIDHFVALVFKDMDSFLGIHDRKMCLIGLGILLSLPANQRPRSLQDIGGQLMPALIKMMDTLKNTYVNMRDEATDDEEEEDEDDIEALDTDEDEQDEEAVNYMEMIHRAEVGQQAVDGYEDGDEEEDDGMAEYATELEDYETVIDDKDMEMSELVHIYGVISALAGTDPAWYQLLTSSMTEEHKKTLSVVMEAANNAAKDRETKRAQITAQ